MDYQKWLGNEDRFSSLQAIVVVAARERISNKLLAFVSNLRAPVLILRCLDPIGNSMCKMMALAPKKRVLVAPPMETSMLAHHGSSLKALVFETHNGMTQYACNLLTSAEAAAGRFPVMVYHAVATMGAGELRVKTGPPSPDPFFVDRQRDAPPVQLTMTNIPGIVAELCRVADAQPAPPAATPDAGSMQVDL